MPKIKSFLFILIALIWFGGVLYGLDTLAVGIPYGTLVKTPDHPAVYYIAKNGSRYKFPDSGTYHSWYYDFRFVKTITPEVMSAVPEAGTRITVHPGSSLVKFADDEKIYAVANGALLRPIISADVLQQLYGKNWQYRLVKLATNEKIQYRSGSDIDSADDFNRSAAILASQTLDDELEAREETTISSDPSGRQTPTQISAFEPKLQLLRLNLRGKIRPDFHPDRLLYRITADPYERFATLTPTSLDPGAAITVNGLSIASGIQVPLVLNDGLNIIRINVRSSTDKERVYIIMVSKNKSDDNNILGSLSENLAANLVPSFRSGEDEYRLKANYNEDTVKLRPTADNASATVKINGNTVGRGGEFAMFLQPGENTAAIEVTAQSGASRRYNVIIDRSRFPDADALDLSSLSTSLKDSISPVFNPKHTLYFVNARVDEEAVTITARPKRPGSSVVMINGATTEQKRVRLYSGLNEIIIRVDIDEKHSNTYKLTIDKEYN